ncbi:MAG: hypothetical protein AB7U46_16070 [Paenirhodobacter sp.]|uniref:hypothetical protein n=1 Tax=Paenirhodobacter sp. TaxID=1965326 RepID=UPI003D0F585A
MSVKRLSVLLEISRIRRDVEMAALARLTGERQRLSAARDAVACQEREAREAGLASPQDGLQAERFSAWTARRAQALEAQAEVVAARIEAQKQATRIAVGREHNLEKISDRLVEAARKQKAKNG